MNYDQDYDEALAEHFVAAAGAWPSPAFPSVGDLMLLLGPLSAKAMQ